MVTQVFSHVGNTITYDYDFGDGWMHHLELGVRTHVHLKIVVAYMVIKNYWKY